MWNEGNAWGIRSAVAQFELTPRQAQVAEGVAHGLSNDAIAERLSISSATARTHLRNIFMTVNVASRAQLVARVLAKVAADDWVRDRCSRIRDRN